MGVRHIFETRRALKVRIAKLESEIRELRHHTLRSALVDAADLPPCKSMACYNCKHIVFMEHPTMGSLYLLGCGKELSCDGFEPREEIIPTWEERKQWLLWRLQAQFPSQSSTLDESCVHAPLPPCHSAQGGTYD